MKTVARAVSAALLVGSMAASSAMAANVVTLSSITAVWQNAAPPAVATVGPAGNFTTARWGVPVTTGGPQSGYDFDGVDGSVGFTVNPPPTSDQKLVGTFVHLNRPIFAPSITSIQLKVSANVDVDGTGIGNKSFLFDFTHLETDNGATPCADGGTNGVGVNQFGCADKVTISYNALSDSFLVGTTLYTLLFTGFSTDSGATVSTGFWTKETVDNPAGLFAKVTSREDALSVVPLPAAAWLLLSGLAGLGVVGRRRRHVAS